MISLGKINQKGNNSLTTNAWLLETAVKLGLPLHAVVLKNELLTDPLNGAYIVNLSSEASAGSHWVALFIEKAHVAYFDSFGFPPPVEVIDFIKKRTNNYLWSQKHIQNINSGYCGQYCLYFISFMTRNYRMPFARRFNTFTGLFSDDPEKNLRTLKKRFTYIFGPTAGTTRAPNGI